MVAAHFPESTSHSLMVLSAEPENGRFPSRVKGTHNTLFVYVPSNCAEAGPTPNQISRRYSQLRTSREDGRRGRSPDHKRRSSAPKGQPSADPPKTRYAPRSSGHYLPPSRRIFRRRRTQRHRPDPNGPLPNRGCAASWPPQEQQNRWINRPKCGLPRKRRKTDRLERRVRPKRSF